MKKIFSLFLAIMFLGIVNLQAISYWNVIKDYGEKKFKEKLQEKFDEKLKKLNITVSIPIENCLQAIDYLSNGEIDNAIKLVKSEIVSKFVEVVVGSDFAPLISWGWEFAKSTFLSLQQWGKEQDKKFFVNDFLTPLVEKWKRASKIEAWNIVKTQFEQWFSDHWQQLGSLEWFNQKEKWRNFLYQDTLYLLRHTYQTYKEKIDKKRVAINTAQKVKQFYREKEKNFLVSLNLIANKLFWAGKKVNRTNLEKYQRDKKWRQEIDTLVKLNQKAHFGGYKVKVTYSVYRNFKKKLSSFSWAQFSLAASYLKTTGFSTKLPSVAKYLLNSEFRGRVKEIVKSCKLTLVTFSGKEANDLKLKVKSLKDEKFLTSFLNEYAPYIIENGDSEVAEIKANSSQVDEEEKIISSLEKLKEKLKTHYNLLLSDKEGIASYQKIYRAAVEVGKELSSKFFYSQRVQGKYLEFQSFCKNLREALENEKKTQKKEMENFLEKINGLEIKKEAQQLDLQIKRARKSRFVLYTQSVLNEKKQLTTILYKMDFLKITLKSYLNWKKKIEVYKDSLEKINIPLKLNLFNQLQSKLFSLMDEYKDLLKKENLVVQQFNCEDEFVFLNKIITKELKKLLILNKKLPSLEKVKILVDNLIVFLKNELAKNQMLFAVITAQENYLDLNKWKSQIEKFYNIFDHKLEEKFKDCNYVCCIFKENGKVEKNCFFPNSSKYPYQKSVEEHERYCQELYKKLSSLKTPPLTVNDVKRMKSFFENMVKSLQVQSLEIHRLIEKHRTYLNRLEEVGYFEEWRRGWKEKLGSYQFYCQLIKDIDRKINNKIKSDLQYLKSNLSNFKDDSKWGQISAELNSFLSELKWKVPYKLTIPIRTYLKKLKLLEKEREKKKKIISRKYEKKDKKTSSSSKKKEKIFKGRVANEIKLFFKQLKNDFDRHLIGKLLKNYQLSDFVLQNYRKNLQINLSLYPSLKINFSKIKNRKITLIDKTSTETVWKIIASAEWKLKTGRKEVKTGEVVLTLKGVEKGGKIDFIIEKVEGDDFCSLLSSQTSTQKNSLKKGHTRLDRLQGHYSFNFSTQKFYDTEQDIATGFVNPKDPNFNSPYFNCGYLIDLGKKSLSSVKVVPKSGYSDRYSFMKAKTGHVYALRTIDGKYVKLKVTRVGGSGIKAFIEFDWVYQPNGSNSF